MEVLFTITPTGQIANKPKMKAFFEAHEPGTYLLTSKARKIRSLPQNAYIHGVLFPEVLIAMRNAGYAEIRTPEDAKVVCKELFLKKQITNGKGDSVYIVRNTSDLTKLEMTEFIENVRIWAFDYLGHEIQLPNTQTELHL